MRLSVWPFNNKVGNRDSRNIKLYFNNRNNYHLLNNFKQTDGKFIQVQRIITKQTIFLLVMLSFLVVSYNFRVDVFTRRLSVIIQSIHSIIQQLQK